MRLSAKELIQPVSDDLPCGEDLEYDPAFQQMEAMLQTKSEQEFGDTVIPGTGPDWKGVGKQAVDLLKRTRDLRVLSYAAISQLHTDGLGAFRDGLEALNACLETHWDIIYPALDAEDNNDATMRFNTLQILNDNQLVSDGLERSPLVVLKGVGVSRCAILNWQRARLKPTRVRKFMISQSSRVRLVMPARKTWLRWVPRLADQWSN